MLRRLIEAFAPPDAVETAVERILGGERACDVALDLGLQGDDRRLAADRAKARRGRAKVRRRRKAATRCL